MTVPQKEQIVALRGQGLSYLEIADRVGISKNTIKTFCRRNAIDAVIASEETKHNDFYDHCPQCGSQLQKTRSTKKFCSSACRLAYHKAHRPPSTVCVHCGIKFNDNGNRKRKYCSVKCCTASRFPVSNTEGVVV